MTNPAIAAVLMASGVHHPQAMELLQTRILTCKGTLAQPGGGCGIGCTDLGNWFTNWVADITCASGMDMPQDVEEVGTIVLTKGHRTDNLNW